VKYLVDRRERNGRESKGRG